MTLRFSNAVAKALADEFDAVANADASAAYLEFRTGAQPPGGPDAAATGTLLGTCTASVTAFGAATDANPGGRITANAVNSDTNADATGTIGWARLLDGAGTPLADFACATSGSDINFAGGVSVTAGDTIAVSSLVLTWPES